MGMPDLARTWTRAEVLAIPDDGNRYELVDGELLVSPSPRGPHQRGLLELILLVHPYVRAHRLGYTTFAPADLDLQSGQLLQPDLFVGAMVGGREPVEWADFAIPILIAEILSPSTARYDRITKRRRYQRSGVGTYWVVDLDARLVEVWTPDDEKPTIADQSLAWQPDAAIEPLVIELPAYFRAVWAE
jgi:Uma2 family endonuclease